jgi:hypothetical protein
MKLQTNVWITVIMTALQVVAQVSDLLPSGLKHWALAAQIVLEALKALLVHFSNPDGTPAQAAYQPYTDKPKSKTRGVMLMALPLLFVPALSAQTRARPEQLAADPAPTARVLVVLPSGVVALANMQDLVLDTSGPVPVLRASVAIASRMRRQTWKPVAIESTFTLQDPPAGESLHVWRNGLLLSEGEDYTIDGPGTRITLKPGLEARPGDIMRAFYFY